jgi:hypothetical protein
LLPLQIAMSALLLLTWRTVWVNWRNPHTGRRGLSSNGFLARNMHGMLPAVIGFTFFVIGGWVLYSSPSGPDGAAVGIGHYVGGSLIGVGCVFTLFFMTVYWTGRPRFMVSPSMRPERREAAGIAAHRPQHAAVPPTWSPLPGEYVAGCFTANHLQGDYLCRGRLFVTRERLVYVPGPHSAAGGGVLWEAGLDQASARVAWSDPWGGGGGAG